MYELTREMGYHVPELNLPEMKAYSLKGKLMARAQGGFLIISPGYAWDGCTAIGRLVETSETLRASCLHDFLYQLAEQPDYEVPYTQRMVDKAFLRYLPLWAKPLWYLGVRLCGWVFYGDTEQSLRVEIQPNNNTK